MTFLGSLGDNTGMEPFQAFEDFGDEPAIEERMDPYYSDEWLLVMEALNREEWPVAPAPPIAPLTWDFSSISAYV